MKLAHAVMVVALLQTSSSRADGPVVKEATPGLQQQAKFGAKAALQLAQAKVPKGKVVTAELEVERGKLIYSFDVKTEGKPGIDEVVIDASSGALLSVEHETPADEQREKAADSK